MSALDVVLHRLETATGRAPRKSGSGWMALCPATGHPDRNPSLSVTPGVDRALLHCHAGCRLPEILRPLDLSERDLFDTPADRPPVAAPLTAPAPRAPAVVDAEYIYTDEHGTELYRVERLTGKRFRQKRPTGAGRYVYNLDGVTPVPYRLVRLLAAVAAGHPVHIVEGEKDVHAVEAAGGTATCNSGGAGKWRPEFARYLAGADVIVVPDRDEPGRRHAAAVAATLTGVAARVRVMGAATGKDTADHLGAGHRLDELVPVDLSADSAGTAADSALITAKYPLINWHDLFARASDEIDWLVEPLIQRGQSIVLFAPPKTGKSLLSLEIAAALSAGRPVLANLTGARRRVLYVDLENTPNDLHDRLTDMGYGPGDLDQLYYASFPALPTLDTDAGGRDLLALAVAYQADLVILDTVSRLIAGPENDADTFAALYRHTMLPLKAAGIAVLRLDHAGKDLTAGQRGSSAKNADVDAVWRLVDHDGVLALERIMSRSPHGESLLHLTRTAGPLTHQVSHPDTAYEAEVAALARRLDEYAIPLDHGRDRVRKTLTAAGQKVSNKILTAAIAARKKRENLSGTGPAPGTARGQVQPVLETVPENPETPARSCPGQVADSPDSDGGNRGPDLSVLSPPLKGGQVGTGPRGDPVSVGPCALCGAPIRRYGDATVGSLCEHCRATGGRRINGVHRHEEGDR